MQFYEVIQFIFIEDFMHCVVVSKTPSQLYKFVQLPKRLKEKKNQLKLKCNRNQITLVSKNLPAVSKQLKNIKSYHVSQCKDIGACCNIHTSCLLGGFSYVNVFFFFASHFCFYGSYYVTYKKPFPLVYVPIWFRGLCFRSCSSGFLEFVIS